MLCDPCVIKHILVVVNERAGHGFELWKQPAAQSVG